MGWGNGAGSAEAIELGDLGRGWERKPGGASALRGGGGGRGLEVPAIIRYKISPCEWFSLWIPMPPLKSLELLE